MRTLGFVLLVLLCACKSKKQVQSDFSENVRLTNTTATTSSSQSLLDVVLSWSIDFDSLDICVEPVVDSCRTSAAVAAAQPSRLHLRARHASIDNRKWVNKSVKTDSLNIDSIAVHRTTQRENKTESESSGVYKPPNVGLVLVVLVVVSFIIFSIDKFKK